jgi:hypothetical protein
MKTDSLKYPFTITRFFIPEFTARMRYRRDVKDKPSPRQSMAMCNLLLPPYMRKGYLSFENLVEIAIKTSRVDDQGVAERVACEILLDIDEANPSPEGEPLSALLSEKDSELMNFLQTEVEKGGLVELEARYDSDVDIFKKFSSEPDLGVGPGEDELLKAGIRKVKNQGGEQSKIALAEFLKVNLLKLGREFERNFEFLHNPKLRPFEPGDDSDLIDEERSLEHILDIGRKIDEVRYRDFLIRKRDKKRKYIVYIQDISNTMFYEMNGVNSIQYSIMALVPLIYSLRREKYGLALYESNSHIQKDLYEDSNLDEHLDCLLSLATSTTSDVEKTFCRTRGSQTWGGTVPNKSLKWALEHLEEAGSRGERLCFFFSDFVLEEPDEQTPEKMENYRVIEMMRDRGIRVLACVSPLAYGELFSPYTKHSLTKIEEAGCNIIETMRPREFMEGVQAFLEAA